MSTKIGAHALVRRSHEERILRALREHGALSRGELARVVGLSRTTLSEITSSLLSRRAVVIINTDAAERAGSGRPAERLALDPASGQFLGVDFGHRRVHVVVADASHDVVASGFDRYENGANWKTRLDVAFDLIDRLSSTTGVHYGSLQAIGIGVPGPFTGGRSGTGSTGVAWNNQMAPDGVDTAFGERFGAPVIVDNNTRLAALAEAIASQGEKVSDLIYVRLSDGVGGGLVVAGRLVTGARGFAGELGHVTADPSGRMCRCGKRGCLETIASVPAILRACRERGVDVHTLDDLNAASLKHDPKVHEVFREVGATVGRVLGSAAMTLNPEAIVIGGEIIRIAPVIVEQAAATLRYELYSIPTSAPVVRAAVLADNDGALGAIAAIFHQSPLLAGYPEPTRLDKSVPLQRSYS
jgi:predicted NBD/HSP70 family sugar kinase